MKNEEWYPRIVLTTVLDVNDLRDYPDDLNIYRGCDVSEPELNHESYGQSWSLCKSVAKAFAYEHYSSQQWFNSGTRTVLEANISKSDVYLAVLDQPEKEIVVNTRKLKHVGIS